MFAWGGDGDGDDGEEYGWGHLVGGGGVAFLECFLVGGLVGEEVFDPSLVCSNGLSVEVAKGFIEVLGSATIEVCRLSHIRGV